MTKEQALSEIRVAIASSLGARWWARGKARKSYWLGFKAPAYPDFKPARPPKHILLDTIYAVAEYLFDGDQAPLLMAELRRRNIRYWLTHHYDGPGVLFWEFYVNPQDRPRSTTTGNSLPFVVGCGYLKAVGLWNPKWDTVIN